MAIAKVFKNRIHNARVFDETGRMIIFYNGKHITTIQRDIDFLQKMVDDNDAYVFVDPNEVEVDTEELTEEGRIAKLKREAIAEFLAAQAAAAKHSSTSTEGKLNVGTTEHLMKEVAVDAAEKEAAAAAKIQIKAPTK
jgi:predicted HicB family RNase H-like nuclease